MKTLIVEIIFVLFIFIWVLAALNKLFYFKKFRATLSIQTTPQQVGYELAWILPIMELITAGLLCSTTTQTVGIHFSFILMLLHVGYTLFYARYPGSANGLFKIMSWNTHLILKILLALISLTTILVMN
ncbi:MAG: hypothetical protein JEZ09_21335 [Salinivirgaceae bacterium]|nr:hypothetical protein [Salinivirgaceae bacterium]